jgi:hypothetical protein
VLALAQSVEQKMSNEAFMWFSMCSCRRHDLDLIETVAVFVGINSGSYESPNGETTDRAILPIYYLNIKIPRYENYLTRT